MESQNLFYRVGVDLMYVILAKKWKCVEIVKKATRKITEVHYLIFRPKVEIEHSSTQVTILSRRIDFL